MIAVIQTGGQQFKVQSGDLLTINKLEIEPGEKIEFNDILMIVNGDDVNIGTPFIAGAQVIAEVVEQKRGKKIEILKFKRRKHHMKRMGHRQYLTTIKINEVKNGS